MVYGPVNMNHNQDKESKQLKMLTKAYVPRRFGRWQFQRAKGEVLSDKEIWARGLYPEVSWTVGVKLDL